MHDNMLLASRRSNVNLDFPEVSAKHVQEASWSRVGAFPVHRSEPTHLKEARGSLWIARHLAEDIRKHGHRALVLSGYLGVARVFEKGRSSDPRLASHTPSYGFTCHGMWT